MPGCTLFEPVTCPSSANPDCQEALRLATDLLHDLTLLFCLIGKMLFISTRDLLEKIFCWISYSSLWAKVKGWMGVESDEAQDSDCACPETETAQAEAESD